MGPGKRPFWKRVDTPGVGQASGVCMCSKKGPFWRRLGTPGLGQAFWCSYGPRETQHLILAALCSRESAQRRPGCVEACWAQSALSGPRLSERSFIRTPGLSAALPKSREKRSHFAPPRDQKASAFVFSSFSDIEKAYIGGYES